MKKKIPLIILIAVFLVQLAVPASIANSRQQEKNRTLSYGQVVKFKCDRITCDRADGSLIFEIDPIITTDGKVNTKWKDEYTRFFESNFYQMKANADGYAVFEEETRRWDGNSVDRDFMRAAFSHVLVYTENQYEAFADLKEIFPSTLYFSADKWTGKDVYVTASFYNGKFILLAMHTDDEKIVEFEPRVLINE